MTRNFYRDPSRCERRRQLRQRKNRQGATLVEFAVVSNLLFMLIFGCIELSRLNMARNLAQDAAYYAARVAIVPGATAEEAKAEVTRLMGSLFSGGYEVNCPTLTDETEEVTVTVTVNFDEIAFFVPMFMGGVTFDATATMQTERYNGFFEAD
ncbi:MAG: TadE/TadG family type IV pilus assembly protein [Planctomycetota bacterium]